MAGAGPPIFIVGAPRSGTTLLRNMLNRHPKLAICGETRFYHYIYKRRKAFGNLSNGSNRRRLVEEYLSTERAQRLGMNLAELGDSLMREATGYREFFACVLEQYAQSQGKPRYGEKTPHHALFTETLCEWFPGAFIIHLVRDPRDVVASLQRMVWAPNSVLANARDWVACNRGAMRSAHRAGYRRVRYEDLVAGPERELTGVCEFVGCTFAGEMLTPDEQASQGRRHLRAHQQRIDKGRLERWREQLTADEVGLIEWAAGEQMRAFGYEPAGVAAPSWWRPARARGFAAADAVRKQVVEFPGVWYTLLQPTRIAREEYWRHRRDWAREGTPAGVRWRLMDGLKQR